MQSQLMGKVRKAPENFVRADDVGTVFAEARAGRRDFIRGGFSRPRQPALQLSMRRTGRP